MGHQAIAKNVIYCLCRRISINTSNLNGIHRFKGVKNAELAGARVLAYPASTMDKTYASLLGMRVVFGNQHHKSGIPLQVHFGLGAENKVDIKVVLNCGKTVVARWITANKAVEIDLSRGS